MKTSNLKARKSGGSVAVEMAIVLPLMVLILAVPLFFARVFWFYSVAQKAAHDGARFLSTAAQAEMRTVGAGGTEASAAAVARWIATTETEVAQPVMDPLWIYVQCGTSVGNSTVINYGNCGAAVPKMVRVYIEMSMKDNIFSSLTYEYFGEDGLPLKADVAMRYVGN